MSKLLVFGGLAQGQRRLQYVADAGAEILGYDTGEAVTANQVLKDPARAEAEIGEAATTLAISASNALISPFEIKDYIAVASPVKTSFLSALGGSAEKLTRNIGSASQKGSFIEVAGIGLESAAEVACNLPLTPRLIHTALSHDTNEDLFSRRARSPEAGLHAVIMNMDELFDSDQYQTDQMTRSDITVTRVEAGHTAVFLDPELVFKQIAQDR